MKKILVLLFLVFTSAYPAIDSLYSIVTGDGGIGVAIFPFRQQGENQVTSDQPWRIMADNFDFTPRISLHRVREYDSAYFSDNNIAVYIEGEYRLEGDQLTVSVFLFDAISRMPIESKGFQYNPRIGRLMAHRFSDWVYRRLFLEPSPFLSRILYVERSDSDKNVYIMDYDGHNRRVLTRSGINIMPDFGADDEFFWVSYSRGKADIYRGNLRSGALHAIAHSRRTEASPRYNPIVDRILFSSSRSGSTDIYTARSDGSDIKRITLNSAIDASPSWSPNGFFITFISDRSGTPQVYVMDRDGGGLRRLTFNSSYHDAPVWSPDGSRIAYTSIRDGVFEICTIAIDGSDEKVHTLELGGQSRYPTWSPDGNFILFENKRGAISNLYRLSLVTGEITQLTNSGVAEMPTWSSNLVNNK